MPSRDLSIHPRVKAIFTSATEGSIATGQGLPDSALNTNRRKTIIKQMFGNAAHTKMVIRYDDRQTYRHIEQWVDVDEIACDALYTTQPRAVIALPVADCLATLVYDPVVHMLGILHLGRHSSVAGLIESFVIEVADTLGSDPRDWSVWMSPSISKEHDRMDYFNPPNPDEWTAFTSHKADGIYLDVAGHNIARFERAGVLSHNIYKAPEDTYSNELYFSQRAADEQLNPIRQGRMMLAASLLE